MRDSLARTHRLRRPTINNALRPIAVRRRFALTHPARFSEHHGDSILRLAGIRRIVDWRPVPGEVVQPRQLPDGLLDGPSLEFKLELAPLCVQWPETAHRAT